MKKIIVSALVAALSFVAANAQSVRENWHEIDKVTVYSQFHANECQTLYVVPVDESAIVYGDDLSKGQRKKIDKNREQFRDAIKKQLAKPFPRLDVKIVSEMPASLGAGEAALQVKYTEFDTGSAALRAFTYGADHCAFAVVADVIGEGGSTLVEFQHRQVKTGNPFGAYYPNELHKSFQDDIAELLTTMMMELNKE